MSKLNGEVTEAFRAAGLRVTSQRYAILEFLVRRPVHATPDEILLAVNRGDPRASRATIYNSLRALARAGLVREVASEGKAARYDASLHRHHHFVCERCGGVEDIPWFDLPAASARAALSGRTLNRYEVVFRGLCMRCGKGSATEGVIDESGAAKLRALPRGRASAARRRTGKTEGPGNRMAGGKRTSPDQDL